MSRDSIALLGTSADPPTLGHQALLEGLLGEFQRVVTWASDNPSKRHGAELKQRSDLLGCVVQTIGNPRLELAQDLSSPYAITTLERARQRQALIAVVKQEVKRSDRVLSVAVL